MTPAAAVVSLALAGATSAEPACPTWGTERDERLATVEDRLTTLVNERRTRLGRGRLAFAEDLRGVARRHAETMAETQTLVHVVPLRGGPDERLAAAGVRDWDRSGENLAKGSVVKYRVRSSDGRETAACHDPESLAFELDLALSRSPGHLENMLDERYEAVGIGAGFDPIDEAVYVAQVFVRRVDCGYLNAPCCAVAGGPALGACLSPWRCTFGTCGGAYPSPDGSRER